MPTYLLAPGAWLTLEAPDGAGFNPPVHPWRAALNPPIVRPRTATDAASNPPILVGGSSHDAGWNPEPRRLGQGTAPDPSGTALYPDWTYQGGYEALQAQALRRTALRVVRPSDPSIMPKRALAGGQRGPRPRADDPFWRWGSEFRVQAVVAELASATVARGREVLFAVGEPARDALRLDLARLLSIVPTKDRGFLDDQSDRTARAAVEREDRTPEILTQMNGFVPFFTALTGIDLGAAPYAAELMAVWSQWADLCVMALKNAIAEARPFQRSSLVMPLIATPPHGSLPSGHATAATMMSEILGFMLYDPQDPRTAQLDRLARRIAFNRVVAGVHFQMDSAAGYALGRQLAGLFVARATATAAPAPLVHKVQDHADLPELGPFAPLARQGLVPSPSPLLAKLWSRAVDELELLRV